MKVVLFCGGLGLRLREHSDSIPKPMVTVGYRPILWHIMKYYAHFGHRDFILCLGWRGDVIKDYFLNYNEALSNDFVLSNGGADIQLLNRDIHDWNITFVDTGLRANIAQRLLAVRNYLTDEEVFLANYADDLTDLHLPDLIHFFYRYEATAAFLSVPPPQSFHTVDVGDDGTVRAVTGVREAGVWVNGGYFVFRPSIFDYIRDGEELVEEPFQRLIAEGRLVSLKFDGFWGCMDTYKEKQRLDDLYAQGCSPWEVWKNPAGSRIAEPGDVSAEGAPRRLPLVDKCKQ